MVLIDYHSNLRSFSLNYHIMVSPRDPRVARGNHIAQLTFVNRNLEFHRQPICQTFGKHRWHMLHNENGDQKILGDWGHNFS